MPYENNDTFKKWHMTNTSPEVDKYGTDKILFVTKIAHLVKKNAW